ncbi:signal peptidase I [Helicobacter sp. MIT 14-3879]|uniref:signal peptidase I n=1 Tax=Helicobacter sp. MIT 14-3879 TaxID=2040649 RepID=UPI000E1F7CAF|nr:signal peptidase I [Helicobacter sp. MIT 14-3879]RDU64164.1 signal peptidase I [Helicobacter sp. MIT 14-3879]
MKKFFINLYYFSTTWVGTIVIVLFVVFFIAQAFVIPSRSMVNTLYEGDLLFVKKFTYGIPIPRIPWIEIPVLPDFNGNGHIIEGRRPARGDIVIFIPPHLEKIYFVKRTFGVGGDEVIMRKDGLYLRPNEGDSYIDEHFKGYEIKSFFGKRFVHNPLMDTYKGIHYNPNNNVAYDRLVNLDGAVMSSFKDDDGEKFFYYKVEDDKFFMVGDNRDGSEDSRFWGSVPYKDIIGSPWFIYFSLNLANSNEAKLGNKYIYKIRWERMFKSVDGLEELAKKNSSKDYEPDLSELK